MKKAKYILYKKLYIYMKCIWRLYESLKISSLQAAETLNNNNALSINEMYRENVRKIWRENGSMKEMQWKKVLYKSNENERRKCYIYKCF